MTTSAKTRIKRFTPMQRLFHLTLMLTFLIQSATGLARMYHETGWGQGLANLFGGFSGALTIHIAVGIFMVCAFVVHLAYAIFLLSRRGMVAGLRGPDSLIPGPGDIREFISHLRWILGLSAHPPLDRWGYWEKFDYWAVFWGMIILGGTGLLLATPLASSQVIPGWGLNVAFWVHRIEAILAMAHIFIIHFFVVHLRRSHFPMDSAMFDGSTDLETARNERSAWVDRLTASGELGTRLTVAPPAHKKIIHLITGLGAVAIGLFLLVGSLMHATRITW
ncbi:formate dehydrogenase subunit gamma [Pseudodesulfovibrio pelocollis]|uniref:formate dehydrogenase subunit gamma n=1 Tax=Pseudodesulfovibrio pelocollis TaxID=3051432 RepID=UPI00255A8D0D|nr:cytochrome b/b6 domain-containing protein [Pseudodesulfovibrio sp. SB368]